MTGSWQARGQLSGATLPAFGGDALTHLCRASDHRVPTKRNDRTAKSDSLFANFKNRFSPPRGARCQTLALKSTACGARLEKTWKLWRSRTLTTAGSGGPPVAHTHLRPFTLIRLLASTQRRTSEIFRFAAGGFRCSGRRRRPG